MFSKGTVVVSTAFLLISLACAEDQAPAGGGLPPTAEWIRVESVPEEYAYIGRQRCTCGGQYKEERQSTGEHDGRHFDQVDAVCVKCGRKASFTFDVTAIFEGMRFADSKSAKARAVAELTERLPKITAALLPEVKELLKSENVHYRVWAIGALTQIPTPEARQLLVRGYLANSLLTCIEAEIAYESAIASLGGAIVPTLDQTLKDAVGEEHWKLADVLGATRVPEARVALEHELRTGPERSKRICTLSLGRLGFRESGAALLEEYRRTAAAPDDALIWALGRSGGEAAIPVLRTLAVQGTGKTRQAAVAALGLAGDRESIPRLLELSRDGPAEVRRQAVYALGKLRAAEAVPLLLELAAAKPQGSFGMSGLPGVYDADSGCDYEGNAKAVSIQALGEIGDARAIPFFRDALGSAAYDLYTDDLTDAAGAAGWKVLVPEIIARFAQEQPERVESYKDRELPEQYSPALRQLTGQAFGEDPELWLVWLRRQTETQPSSRATTQDAGQR